MESSKEIVAGSPASLGATEIAEEGQSQITALLQEMCQQLQESIQNMAKMVGEIEQTSVDITKELEKCKDHADAKRRCIEEDRDRVQKAAVAVLEMLNNTESV